MKKTYLLLPLACSVSVLQAVAPVYAEEPAMRVEPVMSVRHSEPGIDVWYRIGRHHQDENRLDLAADAYRQVLAEDTGHADARNALATVYFLQNRVDEAIAEFRAVLQTHPRLSYVHNNLGYAYLLKTDYLKAIAELGNAIALQPGDARAFGNLALAYQRLGEADNTRTALRQQSESAAPAAAPNAVAPDAPAQAIQMAKTEQTGQTEQTAQIAETGQMAETAQAAADLQPPRSELAARDGIAIEIANGTRDEQLAQKIADELRQDGITVTRVTELKPYTQRRTVILYRDGFYKHALELSHSFSVPPALVNNTRTRDPSDKSNVRLVLGKSAVQAAAVASNGAAGPAF
jgi:tetratricopeptide (TPR) repeat protein